MQIIRIIITVIFVVEMFFRLVEKKDIPDFLKLVLPPILMYLLMFAGNGIIK
jgi:hypothetical protein